MYDWRKMTVEEQTEVLKWRKLNQRPWHSPPHFDVGYGAYHIVGACYEHRPIIGKTPDRMGAFTDSLLEIGADGKDIIHAWCVLPNHYHLLVETDSLTRCELFLRGLHGRLPGEWNREDTAGGRKVFCGFADRFVRSEGHFWASVNYIHNNSVHHGYVTRWQEWPFSSAAAFIERMGRDEVRRIWLDYPILDYGKGWDDPDL